MARLRLFASVRMAAGTAVADFDAATVDEVIDAAVTAYGQGFAEQLPQCRIWLNGEAAEGSERVGPDDEVAVLPPVSGG